MRARFVGAGLSAEFARSVAACSRGGEPVVTTQ